MWNLNNIWKLISQFIGPALLVIAIIFGVGQCNRANRAEQRANINNGRIETATKILERNVDSAGNEHIVFKPNLVTEDQLSIPIDSSLYTLIDSLSWELKVAKNRIVDATIVNSSGKFHTKGTKKDTVIVYKDKTIDWTYNPIDTTLDLGVNLKFNSVTYDDGVKILGVNVGAENLYTDMWWNDKRIKINSVDNIRVVNPIPKNTFELSINSEYRFDKNNVMVGPEAQINLNRWGLSGRYLYNLNTGDKEPTAGIKFHVFK